MQNNLPFDAEIIQILGVRDKPTHLFTIRNLLKKEMEEIPADFNKNTLKTIKQLVRNGELHSFGKNYYILKGRDPGLGQENLELRRTPRKRTPRKRYAPYESVLLTPPKSSPLSPSRSNRLTPTPRALQKLRNENAKLRRELKEQVGIKNQLADLQAKYDEAFREKGIDHGSRAEELSQVSVEHEFIDHSSSPVRITDNYSRAEVSLVGTLNERDRVGHADFHEFQNVKHERTDDLQSADVEELENEILELERAKEDLSKEIEVETAKRLAVEKRLGFAEERIREFSLNLINQKEEYQSRLDLYMTESKNSSLALDAENRKLDSEIHDLKIRLDLSESENSHLQAQIGHSKELATSMRAENEALKSRIKELSAEIERGSATIAELQTHHESEKEELNHQLDYVKERSEKLDRELKSALVAQESYRAENAAVKQEAQLLTDRMNLLKEESLNARNAMKEMRSRIQRACKELMMGDILEE